MPVLLLITSVAAAVFSVELYRRDRDRTFQLYTKAINLNDARDALHNSMGALQSIETEGQNYILTGRAASLEIYRGSVRDWQNESAALELLSGGDPATGLIRDFSKHGAMLLEEVASAVSLYDAGMHEAAMERLREGAGIGFLEQARGLEVKTQDLDTKNFYRVEQQRRGFAVQAIRRFLNVAGAICLLALTGALLLARETYWPNRLARDREPVGQPTPSAV